MKLKKFKIQVEWKMMATVEIEAESLDDAICEAEDMSLPEDGSYVDGSFEVLTTD